MEGHVPGDPGAHLRVWTDAASIADSLKLV